MNSRTDFDQLERLILPNLNEKEKTCLKDFKKYIGRHYTIHFRDVNSINGYLNFFSIYLVKGEGAWVLDQQILDFVAGLLEHRSLCLGFVCFLSFSQV